MPTSPHDVVDLAGAIGQVYADAEEQIMLLIAQYLARGIDTPLWLETLLLDMRDLSIDAATVMEQINAHADVVFRETLTTAYSTGQIAAAAEVGVTLKAVPKNLFAIRNLLLEAGRVREQMGLTILSSAPRVYQQAVTLSSQRMIAGAIDRRTAAAQVMKTIGAQGIPAFVDKAGRTWDPVSYAEMATRTMAGRAVVSGHVDKLDDLGHDLVIVSNSPEECDRCRPWEGKVLSAKGKTIPGQYDGYEVKGSLKMATGDGLFHPNCRHTVNIYLPGITKIPTHTADPEGSKLRTRERTMERGVRKQKVALATTQELMGPKSMAVKKERAKLRDKQAALKAFRLDNGRFQGKARTSLTIR